MRHRLLARFSRLSALLLILQLGLYTDSSWAQHSSGTASAYSLQAALDELHRREATAAKYPLNAPPSQRFGSAFGFAGVNEPDYWDLDTELSPNTKTYKNQNRQRLTNALAKYLERESYDADHGGLPLGPFGGYEFDEDENINDIRQFDEQKKRASSFRERDINYGAPSTSVFRERETQTVGTVPEPRRAELTEQFLREIEEASEHERKERYKEALRHLWEKYQQQENEVDTNLFEEKKKRMRVPPYYMLMQKKRSYPVLPWLPYSADKKKRFPVAKRSAKRPLSEIAALGKTDEKVAMELRELFGKPQEEKKKRSTDVQVKATATTRLPETTLTALGGMGLEGVAPKQNLTQVTPSAGGETHQHGNHAGYHSERDEQHRQHRKRSDHVHHSHEEKSSAEVDSLEDREGHEEYDEDTEEDDHDEFDDDDDEERRKKKRKRDAALKQDPQNLVQHVMMRSKKSIDWSKYFGLDRKKKSTIAAELDSENQEPNSRDESNATTPAENEEHKKGEGALDPEKLESMDKKLQSIEDFIIDETIKYTGAHEGISNQDEIRQLKDHVLSRLATAYSLEKMRRALDKLRQSVENENHLLRNVIEPDSDENDIDLWHGQKRVAFKKDTAGPLENSSKNHESKSTSEKKSSGNVGTDGDVIEDGNNEMKKKKKRSGYLRYPELPNDVNLDAATGPGVPYESFNDAYLGNKNYMIGSNQCPLIESMAERCRGVDLLSGDINQQLLPICGVHQICYLCGSSQIACDYQYLAEADTICGSNSDCQSAARSVLMILRGSPGPQLGPRECLKNPCLYSAMRELGL